MPKIAVFDPPQCCASGVCGPEADEAPARFAAALDALRKRGIEVARYDLGHQPGAFVENGLVKARLERDGMACLPLTMVDGAVLASGSYPDREVLEAAAGLAAGSAAPATAPCCAPSCCGGSAAR